MKSFKRKVSAFLASVMVVTTAFAGTVVNAADTVEDVIYNGYKVGVKTTTDWVEGAESKSRTVTWDFTEASIESLDGTSSGNSIGFTVGETDECGCIKAAGGKLSFKLKDQQVSFQSSANGANDGKLALKVSEGASGTIAFETGSSSNGRYLIVAGDDVNRKFYSGDIKNGEVGAISFTSEDLEEGYLVLSNFDENSGAKGEIKLQKIIITEVVANNAGGEEPEDPEDPVTTGSGLVVSGGSVSIDFDVTSPSSVVVEGIDNEVAMSDDTLVIIDKTADAEPGSFAQELAGEDCTVEVSEEVETLEIDGVGTVKAKLVVIKDAFGVEIMRFYAAVKAESGSGSEVETSTEAPTETSTEAKTETSTEAPTEATTEAVKAAGFEIEVADVDGAADTFDATIKFNDPAGVGMNNYTFVLTYPETLSVESVTNDAENGVVYTANGTTYQMMNADRVKAQVAKAETSEGRKVVTLAGVAGIADNGSELTALDQLYTASGSVMATIRFKFADYGDASVKIEEVSNLATLNTLVDGKLTNVAVAADNGVIASANYTYEPASKAADVEYTVEGKTYDLSIAAEAGSTALKFAGALYDGYAYDATANKYSVTLVNDVDVAALVKAFSDGDATVSSAGVVTVAGSNDTLTITYKNGDVEDVQTIALASAKTIVEYSVTAGAYSVAVDANGAAVSSTDASNIVSSAMEGDVLVVTVKDGVDVAAINDAFVAATLPNYVTVSQADGVLTFAFNKPAENGTTAVEQVNKIKFVANTAGESTTDGTTESTTEGTTEATTEGTTQAPGSVAGEIKVGDTGVKLYVGEDGKVTATVNDKAVLDRIAALNTEDTIYVPVQGSYKDTIVGNGTLDKNVYTVKVGDKDVKLYLFSFGDVNGDGKVNANDSNMIRSNILGKTAFDTVQSAIADVTNDSKTNANDVNQLKAFVRGATATLGSNKKQFEA